MGIPLTLPMGWAESPPAFCAATKTAKDPANWMLEGQRDPCSDTPHQLDKIAESPLPACPGAGTKAKPQGPLPSAGQPGFQRPLGCWDVCADDFLGIAQG